MQNRLPKYIAGWLCAGLLHCAFFALAQPRLSADFHSTPLPEAFRTLEKSGGITVSFDPVLVENLVVSVRFADKTPQEAFDLLLRETPLQATVVRERHVLILRRSEPAPPVTLRGQLLDTETREALAYASIFSEKTKRGTQSDGAGNFSLDIGADAAATDTLLVRMLGYRTLRIPASRLLRGTTPLALPLRPISRELVEITITDRALEALQLPASDPVSELRTNRGGLVPSLGEPDPFRMIQSLPGVAARDDKADELIVRGGNPDQNLVLWEGIPIYHTGHLFGLISALNPYVVDRVNVWKGNFSADYGGRVSSMIDLRTDPRPLERPSFSVGVNLVNTYFSIEAPLFKRKGGLLFAGRHAFSGVLESSTYQKLFGFATQNSRIQSEYATQQGDSVLRRALRLRPTSNFSDSNLKLWWRPNPNTFLDLNAYFGYDVLRYSRSLDLRDLGVYFAAGDTLGIANFGFSTHLRRQWTPRFSTLWRLAVSAFRNKYDFAGSFNPDVADQFVQHQDNNLREGVVQFDNNWRLAAKHHLQFGLQLMRTDNFFHDQVTNKPKPADSHDITIDLPTTQSALYGIWRLGDSAHWYLEAGVRHVTFNRLSRSFWEPRLSAQIQIGRAFRLKAAAGIFHQFMRRVYVPNVLGLNNEVWFTTDESLKLPVLESGQVSAGFSFEKRGWLFDVEFYSKQLKPIVGADLRFNDTPEKLRGTRGVENVGGLEVLLRKRWGGYTQLLGFAASGAEMKFDSLNTGQPFAADFDQPLALNWSHELALKRWSFNLSWSFHTGHPYTPPTGIVLEQKPDGSFEAAVGYEARNSARLPDYSRVDASLQYHFGEKALTGSIGLSAFNLLNSANLQGREFFVETRTDSAGNPIGYGVGTLERTLLSRMVNLFLLLRW